MFPLLRLSLCVFCVFLFSVGEEDLFACFDEWFPTRQGVSVCRRSGRRWRIVLLVERDGDVV
jgi:hypothetical protein